MAKFGLFKFFRPGNTEREGDIEAKIQREDIVRGERGDRQRERERERCREQMHEKVEEIKG